MAEEELGESVAHERTVSVYRRESALSCDGNVSDYFPVNTGIRQGCVLVPTLSNTCMDQVLGRMSERGLRSVVRNCPDH